MIETTKYVIVWAMTSFHEALRTESIRQSPEDEMMERLRKKDLKDWDEFSKPEGSDPAKFFTEQEIGAITDFLNFMRKSGYPGADSYGIAGTQRSVEVVTGHTLFRNRPIKSEKTLIDKVQAYRIGTVESDDLRDNMGESVSAYLCVDGMLRQALFGRFRTTDKLTQIGTILVPKIYIYESTPIHSNQWDEKGSFFVTGYDIEELDITTKLARIATKYNVEK